MSLLRGAPKQRKQRIARTGKRQGIEHWQSPLLFEKQGGRCAVGGEPLNPDTMVVDHCHQCAITHGHAASTGCPKCYRGLVCPRHNSALGWLGDDFESIRRAAVYVGHGRH